MTAMDTMSYITIQADVIINKSPLKNIERITPNIYNVDIRGYLFSYYRNNFFYLSFFRYLLARF